MQDKIAENLNLSKAERKKLKRQIKRELKGNELKKRKIQNYSRRIAALVVVVAVVFLGYRWITQPALVRPGEEFSIEGKAHVPVGTKVDYQTNPPTSGDHYGEPADCGVYNEELIDETVVHSLEHGGVWITYKDIDEDTLEKLEEIGKDNPGSVIVIPRSANDVKIAVASWGRLLKMDEMDEDLIRDYIRFNKNFSPEKLAR